jgi:hypothetical protein
MWPYVALCGHWSNEAYITGSFVVLIKLTRFCHLDSALISLAKGGRLRHERAERTTIYKVKSHSDTRKF